MTRRSPFLLAVMLTLHAATAFPQTAPNPAPQTRRALLIAIDHYAPAAGYPPSAPAWIKSIPELEGCRNDALSIQSQLTSRFGFAKENITTLWDQDATRAAILTQITALLNNSRPGDIACIYYAGHGTRIHNSGSAETDKLDESIVPADTWRPDVKDIRDKELAPLFNAFIDKQVTLTLIADCCHSGSLSRGLDFSHSRYRYAPQPDYDAADNSRSVAPGSRPGNYFLALTATQSDERAAETRDDTDTPHGLFTLALNHAWNSLPPDIPAQELYTSVKAILAANGFSQQPSLDAPAARRALTLFGTPTSANTGQAAIAVETVNGNNITLQGGWALQLAKGNLLAAFGKTPADTLALLQIDTVLGLNTSRAHLLKNTTPIQPGQRFFVTNWISSGQPLLKVYIPSTGYTRQQTDNICRIAANVRHSRQLAWIDGWSHGDPYACLIFDRGNAWWKTGNRQPIALDNLTAQSILQRCPKDSTLYMEIPISDEEAAAFRKTIGAIGTIQLVTDPALAQYTLYGRLGADDRPAFGLRKIQIAARDSLTEMPPLTDAVNDPDSLANLAQKLAKLRGWLSVITSPEGGSTRFPYHLEIVNQATKDIYRNNRYRIGDIVAFKLVRDSGTTAPGHPAFIYVFTIDATGSMHLVSSANNDDALLQPVDGLGKPIMEKLIAIDDTIAPPVGVDNYFMLATTEALPDPGSIFNQDGVFSGITRAIKGSEPVNPLLQLLDTGNNRSKGTKVYSTPATWALRKRSFICSW